MPDPKPSASSESLNTPVSPGPPAGDFGAPAEELLVDGQEEVFSRSEVASGRIEHLSEAGSSDDREAGPRATPARRPTDRAGS